MTRWPDLVPTNTTSFEQTASEVTSILVGRLLSTSWNWYAIWLLPWSRLSLMFYLKRTLRNKHNSNTTKFHKYSTTLCWDNLVWREKISPQIKARSEQPWTRSHDYHGRSCERRLSCKTRYDCIIFQYLVSLRISWQINVGNALGDRYNEACEV